MIPVPDLRQFKLEFSARKFVHSILRAEDRLWVFEVTENAGSVYPLPDMRTIEHGIDALRTTRNVHLRRNFLCSDALDREGCGAGVDYRWRRYHQQG